MPSRVQRLRVKGWRMPPDTVYVGRPTKWGNPFLVSAAIEAGLKFKTENDAARFVVGAFRDWLVGPSWRRDDLWQGPESERRRLVILDQLAHLRGKSLCCWCPLDRPCHADVLLELAHA